MLARLTRMLVMLLVAGCVLVPAVGAQASAPSANPAATGADAAIRMLESVDSIEVHSDATVVTLRSGRKTHPIVIDYGALLQTRASVRPDSAPASSAEKPAGSVAASLAKGFSLGQLGALLLGLTVVSRTLRIFRQLVPARER